MNDEEPDETANSQMNDRVRESINAELSDMPIYHDHLIDDVINRKVDKLINAHKLLKNQRNNDSRSTQQAFESSGLARKHKDQNQFSDQR